MKGFLFTSNSPFPLPYPPLPLQLESSDMVADFGEKTVSACLKHCMTLRECLYATFIDGGKTSGGQCWIFSKACSDPPNTEKKWMEGGLSFKKVEPCGKPSDGNVCRPKLPTAETKALVAETCECSTLSDAPNSCNDVAHCVHTSKRMVPVGAGVCAGKGHGQQQSVRSASIRDCAFLQEISTF